VSNIPPWGLDRDLTTLPELQGKHHSIRSCLCRWSRQDCHTMARQRRRVSPPDETDHRTCQSRALGLRSANHLLQCKPLSLLLSTCSASPNDRCDIANQVQTGTPNPSGEWYQFYCGFFNELKFVASPFRNDGSKSRGQNMANPILDGWVDTTHGCYDFSPAFHLRPGGLWRVCGQWVDPKDGETRAFIDFRFERHQRGKWCPVETPFRFPMFYQVGSCCVLPDEDEHVTNARFANWGANLTAVRQRKRKLGRNSKVSVRDGEGDREEDALSQYGLGDEVPQGTSTSPAVTRSRKGPRAPSITPIVRKRPRPSSTGDGVDERQGDTIPAHQYGCTGAGGS